MRLPHGLFLILISSFAGVLFSCAPPKTVTRLPELEAEEIINRVHERTQSITFLQADGTLTVESPESSGSTSFELQVKRPDSLWMRMSGPFGVSIGTLLLSRQKFIFYNAMENVRISGTPTPSTMERVFNLSLSFDDIIDALTGGFGASINNDDDVHVRLADGHYVLTAHSGSGRKEMWVEGKTFVITKFGEFDGNGKPIITSTATRVERIQNADMPHLIRIIRPRERQSLTIAYRSLATTGTSLKRFTFPHDVREIQLDERNARP